MNAAITYRDVPTPGDDRLGIAGFFSALLHVVVILGIGFNLADRQLERELQNSLDIVLVNAANQETPDEIEFFSQVSSSGGGPGDDVASSPLPWQPDAAAFESGANASAEPLKASVDNDILLTQEPDTLPQVATPDERREQPDTREPTLAEESADDAAKQQLRSQLIARISQQWQEYQKRPRRLYLSPSTQMHEAALYMEDWRIKVERIGNLNYPEGARAKKLTGALIMEVAINPDGSINELRVLRRSEHKLLDDAALRFVQLAAPFAPFPDAIRESTDILHITRTFQFLEDNRVVSRAVTPP